MALSAFETWMDLAIAEAERARGTTGDNPWVGCIIADSSGALIGRGHTRGPGEDHAEIVALRDADSAGKRALWATMVSTLEPCSFHRRRGSWRASWDRPSKNGHKTRCAAAAAPGAPERHHMHGPNSD